MHRPDHRTRTSRTALAFATAALGILAACTSLGTPEDQQAAKSLWDEIEGHREWGYFDDHVGVMKGASPHGKYVATYINDIAASHQADPPYGSILVKENYGSQDPDDLGGYTVMQRIEGYDPENGDWFWARFDKHGEQTHSGKVAFCFDCHFDAEGDDFVFLND